MKCISCEDFRARFEEARSAGKPVGADGTCREHLLLCPQCLTWLEQEEALEDVLGALEEPLPPVQLAARVLAALAPARAARELPRPISAQVEARLDELLELVPSPSPPAGLARRVLARLAGERPPRQRPLRARTLLFVAAGIALVAFGLWSWRRHTGQRPEQAIAGVAPDGTPEADEELVSYALENWELVTSEDLDLWLGGLDPLEQELIESALSGALPAEESVPQASAPQGKNG